MFPLASLPNDFGKPVNVTNNTMMSTSEADNMEQVIERMDMMIDEKLILE